MSEHGDEGGGEGGTGGVGAGGTLYGLGIGPGDPDLITLKARDILARLRKYRGRLPADFTFDRLEANERR